MGQCHAHFTHSLASSGQRHQQRIGQVVREHQQRQRSLPPTRTPKITQFNKFPIVPLTISKPKSPKEPKQGQWQMRANSD